MHAAPKEIEIQDQNHVPVAHIETEDAAYEGTLREFLQRFGCRLIVNSEPSVFPHYLFVIGSTLYVKETIARVSQGDHRLWIVHDDRPEDDVRSILNTKEKLVLFDSQELDTQNVQDILSFLFTSRKSFLDLRTHRVMHRKTEDDIPKKIIDTSSREDDRTIDQDRIQKIVGELFISKRTPKRRPSEKPIRPVDVFSYAIMVLFVPFVFYVLTLIVAGLGIGMSGKFLEQGRRNEALIANRIGLSAVEINKEGMRFFLSPFLLTGAAKYVEQHEMVLGFLESIGETEKSIIFAIPAAENLVDQFLSSVISPDESSEGSTLSITDTLRNEILFITGRLDDASASVDRLLTSGTFPFSTRAGATSLNRFRDALMKARETTTSLDHLLVLYRSMGGFGRKERYLLLFQNSMELRPTGGFIGSVGIVTMDQGVLRDFEVQDVYALDGQLKGHVDPPPELAELLKQEHWYLRDSNWDPDFPKSAEKAAWFYEKETGTEVDGVIAISVPFIVDLLAVVGPIDLPDYQDSINADNFFGKSLHYTQDNFFPGSSQKKDFLGTLSRSLVEKLSRADSNVDQLALLRATIFSLKRHDILFGLKDSREVTQTGMFGWDGRIRQRPVCEFTNVFGDSSCLSDYLYLVEANLGVNKVNYFIKRSVLQQISFNKDGTSEGTLTLEYHNESVGDTGGGGTYLAYLRAFLPQESVVTKIALDGEPVPIGDASEAPRALPYAQDTKRDGVSETAIAFVVPPS
ncbi:MAG: DUF4012 domain-containing protein, partial [bacterium]|nr:DUF4012 domain-containing protein [bacterium]